DSQPAKQAAKPSGGGPENFVVTVDGRDYNVTVKEGTSEVQSVSEAPSKPAPKPTAVSSGDSVQVTASVPGNVLKISVNVGDQVAENDTLIILEAMKMETPVASPCSGEINSIEVEQGEVVEAGQLIMTINA
nr:biotin/lipoyl-binding protein [Candidatus Dadabacteria bacterium]NIQ15414.1 biotin/lipoyl-binding protein [Candidatus Dadabacteria bacterium]